MSKALDALEQRIALLEKALARLGDRQSPSGTILYAPVRIVTEAGRTILQIQGTQNDVSLNVFNGQGHVALSLGVDGTDCGYVAIRDANGHLVAYLNVEDAGARLILENHEGKGGVILFGGDSGADQGGGINICSTGDHVSIDLWARERAGTINFYDGEHEAPRVSLPEELRR